MEDLGWKGEAGVKPRSPKGRAVARGLDARIHFQHTFIPAGDTPPHSHQPIKIPLKGLRYLPRPSAVGRGTIKWPSYPRAMFAFPFSEGSWMWHH
jgi:hypothetical protein